MSAVILPQLSDPSSGDLYMNKEQSSWFGKYYYIYPLPCRNLRQIEYGYFTFLASILVFGSMIGSLTGGLQCQFLGRKKSLIIDNIVVFGSLMTLSFSHNYIILLICRFCLGLSVASLLVNVPSYTGEICQPKVRMLTGSFVMVCNSGGMSTMMVIGAMLTWRTAIQILAGFPILVIILVIFFVPESPIWLIMNNKPSDAKESLMKLRAGNKFIVEMELVRMQKGLEQQNAELEEETNDHQYCSGILEVINALKDKCFLKPFMILLVLFCIGFEWAGLPFIAYYMVGILIEATLKMIYRSTLIWQRLEFRCFVWF